MVLIQLCVQLKKKPFYLIYRSNINQNQSKANNFVENHKKTEVTNTSSQSFSKNSLSFLEKGGNFSPIIGNDIIHNK